MPELNQLPGTMLAEGQPPADFNQLFGDPLDDDYRKSLEAKELGEGEEYLNGLVGPPPAAPQATGIPTPLEMMQQQAARGMAVAKDVSGAFTEAGHWAIGGPMKAMQSLLDVGKELATTIGGPRFLDADGNFDPRWQSADEIKKGLETGELQPLQLPNVGGMMDTPDTYTAAILQGLAQFGTGYAAAGKATGIGNSAAGAMTKAFISDVAAFRGNEGNFANLLQVMEQQFPQTMGPVNDFINADALASKETDATLEGRLKNGLVNIVPNALLPLVISGAKFLRARRMAQELHGDKVPPLGQPDPAPAPPPVSPAEAIVGTPDAPLIQRIEQQLGPEELGVSPQSLSGKPPAPVDASSGLPSQVPEAGRATPPPLPEGMGDVQGIRLFHGSPHDFDKFDASKIGTGEGAQAYGHGLYFAESPGVAQSYKAAGQPGYMNTGVVRRIQDALQEAGGDEKAARELLNTKAMAAANPTEKQQLFDAYNNFDEARKAGKMYEVRLDAKPEQFLDWDKPLKEQSPAIRKLAAQHQSKLEAEVRGRTEGDSGDWLNELSGADLLRLLDRKAGGLRVTDEMDDALRAGPAPNHPGATKALKDAGIVGIRYLDGNSRVKGEGSANYVVFPGNEAKIKITAKDGKPFTKAENDEILAQIRQAQEAAKNEQAVAGGGNAGGPPAVPPGGAPPAIPPMGGTPRPFSQEFKFNWSKIETDDDMKAMAGQVMDAFAPELQALGKGVTQTWKETAAKAEALPAIEMLIGEGAAKGKALDAVQLESAGRIYVSALKDLKAATDLAVSPNAGPEDLMAWDHMLRVFKMAQNLYVPAQAEAGRALNILRKTKGESALYSQELQRMVTAMGGETTLKAKAAALADLLQRGPQTLTPAVLQKSLTAKSFDTVMEMWKAGLLSGPKTHIVNFLSNLQVLGTVVAERKVAGMIGEILDPISGVKAEEAAMMAWGQKQHLREAFRVMAKTFKTGQQEWGGNQVEAPRTPMMSSEHWGVESKSFLGKGLDMMGTVYTLPFRALGASDAFFKELHFGAELKAAALRQATEEASRGKIPADQFPLRLQELMENPTEALRAQAREFAAVNTFTNEPGDILRKINDARNFDNPALRFAAHFIMPFTNTPGKILNFFVDRSPLGLLSAKVRADLTKGGATRDIALAKLGLGTITLGVGFDLAMDGFITGGGPAKNDNKRQALMRGGWRPWSIKVPTGEMQADGITPVYTYAPINRFDPAATPLLLGAALAEMTKYSNGKANRQMDEIWAASTMALADVMMSKTTMMGFANFVEAMSNPSQAADKYMKNAARSMVPAGANWAREEFTDPVMRQAWDLVAAAQSRIPYLSESLPPRLDMWGREMSKEQVMGQPWDALIPSRMSSTKNALPIDRELLRLNKALRYPSSIPMKSLAGGQVSIPLDNLPEAQNRLVTLMNAKASDLLSEENQQELADSRKGHVVRALEQFGDATLVDALHEMIKGEGPLGEDYLEGDDEKKADLISNVKGKYEQAARVQVLREFPQIKAIRDGLPARTEKGIEGAF